MPKREFFTPPTDRQARWLTIAFLVAAVFVVYHNAIWFGFVSYDDDRYVTNNPYVEQGLTWESVQFAFTTVYATNWVPLTWLSHMTLVELFGMSATPHHLLNILLHAGTSVILFLALRRLTGQQWPSAAVAALFAVHPLGVEPVVWVSERKGLLSGFFWMLGLLAYARYAQTRRPTHYALVAVCFALGLLSKPTTITFPFALLLLDYWPLRRIKDSEPFLPRAGALLLEKIPLLLLCIPSAMITYFAQNVEGGHVDTWHAIPFGQRLSNAIISYAAYPAKLVWPTDLALHYPHRLDTTPLWMAAAVFAALAGVTALVVVLRKSRPYLAVGWFWYVGTLFPVSGIVQVGTHGMAVRYAYIPMIGLLIMAAWTIRDWASRRVEFQRALGAAAAVVLVAFGVTAFAETRHWRSSHALFQHALDVTEDNGTMLYSMGKLQLGSLSFENGYDHIAEATRYFPEVPSVHRTAAGAAILASDYPTALKHAQDALAIPGDQSSTYDILRQIAGAGTGETAETARRLLLEAGEPIHKETTPVSGGF